MSYEFEDAKNDEKMAKGGMATMVLALLGAAIKHQVNKNNAQKKIEMQKELEIKKSRLNDLETKWFPSEAQKQEMKKLRADIIELENMM